MQPGKKLLILAHMVAYYEDALICDLAETYAIYDYRSMPCRMAATLSCGLRNDSRVKLEMAGVKITPEQMMLASIADRIGIIGWMMSNDGRNGRKRPASILQAIMGEEKARNENIMAYVSGQEFMDEWNRLAGKEG